MTPEPNAELTPGETLALAELLAARCRGEARFSDVCSHVETLIRARVTSPDVGEPS